MPRPPRIDVSGYCYHVLNRANARFRMFRKEGDFSAFERVLEEAVVRASGKVELLAYCVMGNHWHLVLRTKADGAMGDFMKWLTTTHAGRYRVAHGQSGIGHLYQGRYKSFLIETDHHFLSVCRYVERNAARASLVKRAEAWQWSSLHRWKFGNADSQAMLTPWPILNAAPGSPGKQGKATTINLGRPRNWLRTVNTPLNEGELEALRASANRCRPFGSLGWVSKAVSRFGLTSTMRNPGRPKQKNGVRPERHQLNL